LKSFLGAYIEELSGFVSCPVIPPPVEHQLQHSERASERASERESARAGGAVITRAVQHQLQLLQHQLQPTHRFTY
jgi:hypothetical protein